MMVELKNSSEFSPAMTSKRGPPSIQSSPSLPSRTSPPSPPRMKSLPVAAEGRLAVRTGDQEVLSLVAEEQRQAGATLDDVVALLAVQLVGHADVGAGVGDDVVAVAAVDDVDAVAGLDGVVALVAPHRVVALAGHDLVGLGRCRP